jgi:diaminopimelate dehydrogenase
MPEQTRIAIVGWGNVGRGVRESIRNNPDTCLVGIITRRPKDILSERLGFPVVGFEEVDLFPRLGVDVAILCGGSKKDLPEQGPGFARHFSTVDSFDTHDAIPDYLSQVNLAAGEAGHLALISAGWDPGTFSVERVMADAFIPGSKHYAFYGLSPDGGLSMGHSDALRKIQGVKDARQYTHAIERGIIRAANGEKLEPKDKVWRECFVVLKKDDPSERQRVEPEILGMPTYYKPYKTTVNFVTQRELARIDKERGMRHDGLVVAVGKTGIGNNAKIEYRNHWESNPEATGNILVACARAVKRLYTAGERGAITMLDVPPAAYSPRSKGELLKDFM